MTELPCYLDDDGGAEVHAVEAAPEEVHRQALLVRVGPVFCEDRPPRTGVWIEYSPSYQLSVPEGPVLLTPEVWQQLNAAVEQRLIRRLPWWKQYLVKMGARYGHH
jgi:hypothetical protein